LRSDVAGRPTRKGRSAGCMLVLAMRGSHWLVETGDAASAKSDLETLRRWLRPGDLVATHPVRVALDQPSEKNRVLLTHLADDLRTAATIPGVQRLVKLMRRDTEGFGDFRYELRVAAALERVSSQSVRRLAGPASGPDIEFTARSGHHCGIACYRARSDSPNVAALRAISQQLADGALRAFTFSPLVASFCLELIFDRLPVQPED